MPAILLDGYSLTVSQVVAVARDGCKVQMAEKAIQKAYDAREVVLGLVDSPQQIYGLNTGLGANKDNRITPQELEDFNRRILFSHSVALPPLADRATVRATMLCRLNGLLTGAAGVNPQILFLLQSFLNEGIHPLIPERGSVGMSDLGNMAYVGLALIGEGKVEYQGEIISAAEAMERTKLSPVVLGPKDGLPLVSSNAFSVAKAALLYAEIGDLLDMSDAVYALGFEAQDYNPLFLDPRSERDHPAQGRHESLTYVRDCLKGSRVWEGKNQTLYGAISYKSSCAICGSVRDSFSHIKNLLPYHLNGSDDAPMVLTEEKEIISTDYFIITGLAVSYEMMGISLGHLSKLICNRILRMDNEHFSNLPRFLRPDTQTVCYATMQKTISAMDGEIRHLANPVSLDYLPTSIESEDHGCNTPHVMRKTEQIIDLLRYLVGIEALHCAQASDLAGGPSGEGTKFVYHAVRQAVPFLETDNRDLGADIQTAYQLVKEKKLLYPRSMKGAGSKG